MKSDKILELSGADFGEDDGQIAWPDGGIYELNTDRRPGEVHQRIGPLEWNDYDEAPYYIPITLLLLTEWAKENDCDPSTVRIDMETRSYVMEQIIKGERV